MQHPKELVARVKGLMLFCGVSAKVAAHLAGVPLFTVKEWQRNRRKDAIAPDPAMRELLVNALKIKGASKPET